MDAAKDLTRDEPNVSPRRKTYRRARKRVTDFPWGVIFDDIAVVNRDNLRNRHVLLGLTISPVQ